MIKVRIPGGATIHTGGTTVPNLAQVLTRGNDGGGLQIKNIGDPTLGQDAVTLAYFNAHSSIGSVSSVFGRIGAVVAVAGDYTTSLVTEGSNLYYTAARFNSAFSGKSTSDLSEGSNLYYTNARTILAPITGVSITGGSISGTDTILQAFGKLQNQINGVLGGAMYQGVWNATSNSPALSSGVGTKGYYYVVSVAGSTNLDGITDWKIGDWAIFNGTTWDKVDNTDAVSSVNGNIGAVALTGTANRITVSGANVFDISASYVGQTSITTLGTIGTGTWQGAAIADLYISSASTWNAKQSAISFGTGVQTALGINIGSAGAPVLFNGAGGTPSSLTLTNATGLPPTTGISGWPANASGSLTNNGSGTLSWAPAGTLTSVASADGSVTITNPTTTPDLSVVKLNQGTAYTEVGTLMDETFPGSSLNSSNWSGSLPTGASISSKLIIASGNSDWSRYIQAVKFFPFEKEDFEIYFKAVTKNSGDAWGIAQNPSLLTLYNAPIYIKFDQSNGANSGQLSIGTTSLNANEYGYSQPITFSAGDQLKLTIQKKPGKTITILENITSPTNLKAYGEFALDIRSTGGQYRLSFLGGQQEFTEFKVTSHCRNFGGTTGVVIISDSGSSGSPLTDVTQRWTDVLMKGQTHLFENIGINSWLSGTFTAARVTEFLSGISAKYLIVAIGYNDFAQSVSGATYETNLETIATTAQGLGYTVIFLNIWPSFSADNSSFDAQTSTAATNTGSQYINFRSALTVSSRLGPNYVAADAVHVNAAGHLVIANTVETSANKVFATMLTDFDNTDIKLKSIPFGKSSIPLLGVDYDGRVYKLDPSKYLNDSYPILQGTLYNIQTGSIGISGKLSIGDAFYQKNSSLNGLQIGFNDGTSGSTATNINITNGGVGGTGFPQEFNSITGLRNILMAMGSATGTTVGKQNMSGSISGNDNLLIGSPVQNGAIVSANNTIAIGTVNITTGTLSGARNIGFGQYALKTITTGTDNIAITNLLDQNGGTTSPWATSSTGTILIGTPYDFTGLETMTNGEACINPMGRAGKIFTFGPKGGQATSVVWRPGFQGGTNQAGYSLFLEGARGTGNANPGDLRIRFSIPGSSGGTVHSTYSENVILNRFGSTFTQPALAASWAANLTLTPGAHTALTAATEFTSVDHQGATQTWIDGTTATQRFNRFRAFTANKTTTSATFTDIYNSFFEKSIAGTGVTFTRNWGLGTDGNLQVQGSAYIGAATTAPTASLTIVAGTTSIAPIGLTSGSLTTGGNIRAGQIEFLTDDFYATITTGTARKNITLWDALGTSGRIPYATTNGRLIDDASLIYDTTNGIQTTKHLKLTAAGGAIYIKQGSNATVGRATLVGGTVTVSTTAIATADEIFLTDRGGTITNIGTIYISAVSAGTSFTITSTNILDASDVSWLIIKAA